MSSILSTVSLESNRQIKINFNGGDLSSDGGLLLVKEFAAKTGQCQQASGPYTQVVYTAITRTKGGTYILSNQGNLECAKENRLVRDTGIMV